MEILSEILRIVTLLDSQSKVLPLLKAQNGTSSLSDRYLAGLASDQYTSDEAAAQDLYGSSPNDQRFRTLKSRTFDRLIHILLLLEPSQTDSSEYARYYFKCYRYLTGAQILMRFASRKAGYIVAQKTLTTAERYEFTDLCLTLSVLQRDTAALWEDYALFTALSAKVKKYSLLLTL